MQKHNIVGIVLSAAVTVGLGSAVVIAQEAPALDKTWVAVLASIDTEAETASFKARASDAALRAAEKLNSGQPVRLRWDGSKAGEGDRITGLTPLAGTAPTKVAAGRGHFAMNAEFVSMSRPARTLTFTLPMGSEWLETLESFESGAWLNIRSSLDPQGHLTAVAAIEPLTRPTAQ